MFARGFFKLGHEHKKVSYFRKHRQNVYIVCAMDNIFSVRQTFKSIISAFLASTAALVVPILLSLLGIGFFDYVLPYLTFIQRLFYPILEKWSWFASEIRDKAILGEIFSSSTMWMFGNEKAEVVVCRLSFFVCVSLFYAA